MNLENIAVELKPRSHWQSMDLGFKLGKSEFKSLLVLWCCLAIPLYILIKLAPGIGVFALLVWWWFKPLFEAPMHYWLSRAVFNEPVTYRQCFAVLRQRLFMLVKTYLFLWRFGASRSQNMGVLVIEGAKGKSLRKRLSVFTSVNTQSGWLSFICVNFEIALFYSLLIIASLFISEEVVIHYSYGFSEQPEFNWYMVVYELCFLLAAGLVAPFYVSAGFMLYLNRRTHLEAWDIDVDFKRIISGLDNKASFPEQGVPSSRSGGFGGSRGAVASVILTLILLSDSAPVSAADYPDAAESKVIIDEILSDKDFGEVRLVNRLRYIKKEKEETETQSNTGWLNGLSGFSDAVRLILWFVAIAAMLLLLIYAVRNRKHLASFLPGRGFSRSQPTQQLFDLEIAPESLPVDIPGQARALVNRGRQREAMSLLYRGALSRLVHQYGVTISHSATEQECVEQVELNQPDIRRDTFTTLTRLWLRSAYTRSVLANEDITALCSEWPAAFDSQERSS